MSKRPLISAIMPVYKTSEVFLRRCIESVLKQTEQNFELIIVDDGCPNGSGAICDEYMIDERVQVIHQINSGPSVARNTGIKQIHGDFFTFVDADDVLHQQAWKTALTFFSDYDTDCVVFGWKTFSSKEDFEIHTVAENITMVSAKEALFEIASDNISCGGGYPWNKVWRVSNENRSTLPLFEPSLFAYEDKLWTLQMLSSVKKIVLIPDILYQYRIEGESLTHNNDDWEKRQFNAYLAYDKITEFLKPLDKKAYAGAMCFYFSFSFIDTRIRYVDRWRNEELYQKTREHLQKLARHVNPLVFRRMKHFMAWCACMFFSILPIKKCVHRENGVYEK